MADLRAELQAGLTDRYVLGRELGRGGMATVFLAQDLKHDRPVALKVLHPELAATLGPERFQREVRFAARLQHPHILTVLDSGETAGQLWFTMPYVEGESLRGRLEREGQLALKDALRIAREAAQALHYAHQRQIVHRDIKPENILLTTDGSTLVADFGIARALGTEGGEALTQTGMSVGTPTYMSPEQASGDRSVDARSDIYSLGCVLYEMLAGEPPYTGPNAQVILMRRFTDPVPSVRKTRGNVPEAVDQAIQCALAQVPADRFATAAAFAEALETGAVTPTATPTAIVAGVGGVAAGGAASGTVATGGTPPGSAPLGSAPLGAAPPGSTPPTQAVPASHPGPRASPRFRIPTAAIFLVGLGVLFAWRRSHADGEAGPPGPRRVAVLPFENLGDSANEYFADGITDEVRGKLSQLPGLAVIARASSNEYRHTTKPPQQIARELGAEYLLTATVRWEKRPDGSSRVRVSPELVRVAPGAAPTTTWQQPFDAALTDVFQVQGDIAGKVAAALNLALGSTQKQVLTEKPTANLAAYDAYLKGEEASQAIGVTDPASIRRAMGFYEQAVALDSTFVQGWMQLARANAYYYYVGTATPAVAEAARRAAERVVALAPGRPEAQLALGDYEGNVLGESAKALAAYEAGLKVAPGNADLLTASTLAEQSLGRWESALTHLRQSQILDPRSVITVRRLGTTLIRLHRYPEALSVAEHGVGLAPTNLQLLQNLAMAHLVQGDLAGARAAVQARSKAIEATTLAAHFANYWDMYWMLDDADQRLLLPLTPSAFDDDRAIWAIVLTQTYWLRGDQRRARAYADSARIAFEEQLKATPDNSQQHVFLGLVLAYMGKKQQAIEEGERGVALAPISRDAYTGPYIQHQLVRIYLLVGEPEKALDQLEPLLKTPYHLSPGWLRIDPTFAPLKGNPRFEKLIAGNG